MANQSGAASSSSQQQQKEKEKDKPQQNGAADKKKQPKKEEMSEEDRQLMENIALLAEKAGDSDAGVQQLSLTTLSSEIRSASGSMTSIPKPLKMLRRHYKELGEVFDKLPANHPNKALFADLMAVLAMTYSDGSTSTQSLRYTLQGTKAALETWGHDYVRNLTGEIGREFAARREDDKDVSDLLELVKQMVPYHMTHHAEPDAVDLLIEVEQVPSVLPYVDEHNFERVALYMTTISSYLEAAERATMLRVTYDVYAKVGEWFQAMRVALKLQDGELVSETLSKCSDETMKKQLAFLLAWHHQAVPDADESLAEILSNSQLSERFIKLATDLDIMAPKTLDDIYKPHLDNQRSMAGNIDSARHNLASTFVNAFVNAGFRRDKLMTESGGSDWIYKNKEHAMMSAAASLGVVHLWDVEHGTSEMDKYIYMENKFVRGGACLGMGIICAGVRSEFDPALAVLTEQLDNASDQHVRLGSILGLGIAYCGTAREDAAAPLMPLLEDDSLPLDLVGPAALALGLIYCGTCDANLSQTMIMLMMERGSSIERNTAGRYLALGLGLLYLGRRSQSEAAQAALEAIDSDFGRYAWVAVRSCAFAGTGDVLQVQAMMRRVGLQLKKPKSEDEASAPAAAAGGDAAAGSSSGDGAAAGGAGAGAGAGASSSSSSSGADSAGGDDKEDKEGDDENETLFDSEGLAVVGVALLAMEEDVGADMALRMFQHLLQYGDAGVRRAVPLALGVLALSNPRPDVVDTLSKLSHDGDLSTAQNAIFSLGLVGAGSNNSRIAGLLRSLVSYYERDPGPLFCVRLAQGLLHIGKGAMTVSPLHSSRFLLDPVALSGVLVVMHSVLDMKHTLLGRWHFMLYHIVLAMRPRMLLTVDEDLKPCPVTVRVGQAVDVAGQAGKPKTITGFQTHTSPVLLSMGERAELGTSEYEAVAGVLEGVVIVKKVSTDAQ